MEPSFSPQYSFAHAKSYQSSSSSPASKTKYSRRMSARAVEPFGSRFFSSSTRVPAARVICHVHQQPNELPTMRFIVMCERPHVPLSHIKQRCNVDAQTLRIHCKLHRVRAHLHPRQAQRTSVSVYALLHSPTPSPQPHSPARLQSACALARTAGMRPKRAAGACHVTCILGCTVWRMMCMHTPVMRGTRIFGGRGRG